VSTTRDPLSLTVTPPRLVSIAVTPANSSIAAGRQECGGDDFSQYQISGSNSSPDVCSEKRCAPLLFEDDHWTPAGQEVAAQAVNNYLRSMGS